jgi:hypothetical protein
MHFGCTIASGLLPLANTTSCSASLLAKVYGVSLTKPLIAICPFPTLQSCEMHQDALRDLNHGQSVPLPASMCPHTITIDVAL